MEDLMCCQRSCDTRNRAPGMCPASTQGQPADWRLVIEAFRNGSNHDLVKPRFTMVQVTTRQAVVVFKLNRRRQFRGDDFLLKPGYVARNRVSNLAGQNTPCSIGPTAVELVRRIANHNADHAFTVGCEGRI